jgi:hypothetical protein
MMWAMGLLTVAGNGGTESFTWAIAMSTALAAVKGRLPMTDSYAMMPNA